MNALERMYHFQSTITGKLGKEPHQHSSSAENTEPDFSDRFGAYLRPAEKHARCQICTTYIRREQDVVDDTVESELGTVDGHEVDEARDTCPRNNRRQPSVFDNHARHQRRCPHELYKGNVIDKFVISDCEGNALPIINTPDSQIRNCYGEGQDNGGTEIGLGKKRQQTTAHDGDARVVDVLIHYGFDRDFAARVFVPWEHSIPIH